MFNFFFEYTAPCMIGVIVVGVWLETVIKAAIQKHVDTEVVRYGKG